MREITKEIVKEVMEAFENVMRDAVEDGTIHELPEDADRFVDLVYERIKENEPTS